MRFALVFLASLFFLFQTLRFDVSAFTAGNLLPAYICGPPNDGLPKSLAGFLPYVQRLTNPNGSNQSQPVRVDYATDAGTVLNTQLLLANWHNRPVIYGCNKTIFVNTTLNANNKVVNQIVPGQLHTLTLIVNGNPDTGMCDTHQNAGQVTAAEIENIALDGAVLWAQIGNANAPTRVGTFTAFGAADAVFMQPWAACGPNNVGIVHTQLLSETGTYTGIQWQAPANLVVGSTVTFTGAADTDVGFGKHVTTLPVIAPAGAGIVVAKPKINLVVELAADMAIFFSSTAKGAAANAAVPTSFNAKAVFSSGMTFQTSTKQSPAMINIKSQQPGTTATVTVTASNGQATASTSDPVSYTVKGGATVVNNKVAVDAILSLCPGDVVAQQKIFGQDTDPDYQCETQDKLVANQSITLDAMPTIISNGAVQQSPVFAITALLTLAVAAVALKH